MTINKKQGGYQSINKQIWNIIDNDASIKKNLLDNLINISALARKIAEENDLTDNIDAVISAIRRYEGSSEKKATQNKVYAMLKNSKLSTRTKLVSLLLRKNQTIRKKLVELYSKMDFEAGDTLRIFEVTKYIKIIIDDKNLPVAKKLFHSDEIVEQDIRLGELSIDYNTNVTKTPGVFATLSNELATNNISIIDSMICHSEHIFIVDEKSLEEAFKVVFRLTQG